MNKTDKIPDYLIQQVYGKVPEITKKQLKIQALDMGIKIKWYYGKEQIRKIVLEKLMERTTRNSQ